MGVGQVPLPAPGRSGIFCGETSGCVWPGVVLPGRGGGGEGRATASRAGASCPGAVLTLPAWALVWAPFEGSPTRIRAC